MTGAPKPDVRIYRDLAALSRAAAELVLSAAAHTIASRKRFTLVLSGGSTPRRLYSLLAAPPAAERIPWHEVHIFWSDERCVPPAHGDSNYLLASETLLSRVPVAAKNVHRIRGEAGPDRAAAEYEQELKRFFGTALPAFDLVLLGAGDDGHTASLFPQAPQLNAQDRMVLPVPPRNGGHGRVTLSLPVLNNAAQVLFLVSGGPKAAMVRDVLQGAGSSLPAAQVRPGQGSVVWLLDRDAAGRLEGPVLKAVRA